MAKPRDESHLEPDAPNEAAPKPKRRAKRKKPATAGAGRAKPAGQRGRTKRTPRRPADPAVRADKIAKLRTRIDKLQAELADLTGDAAADAAATTAGEAEAPAVPPSAEPSPPPSDEAPTERQGRGPETEDDAWLRGGVDPSRDLLTSDYFRRQWGRLGIRRRSTELDDFGLDAKTEGRLRPVLEFLAQSYFRADVHGIHQIPGAGRCLLVANHSGGPVPYDGLLLRTLLRKEHPNRRELRWLTEDLFYHLPFVGVFMTRLGAVRACQENAQRLLRQGHVVAVFPEGAKGVGKLYRNRYRLQRFGRGGYIRLCIRTHTPLVPCAIVGAEEANPMLYRLEYMTRFLGVPYVPITPTFPLLGPLGLLPAPTKLTIRFGEPIYFDGYPPEAADDAVLVGRLSDRVRASIQSMLDDVLEKRQSVFLG